MYNVEFFGTFDIAALMLLLFTMFFLGLIIYLRREDRREGYPIEDDVTGRPEPGMGFFFAAQPKAFALPNGGGTVYKPDGVRDAREFAVGRRSRVSGTPFQPTGDPMLAGVGPGAYAERAKTPDLTEHGSLKIAPLRNAPGFSTDPRDPNLIGMTVLGADGVAAGVVSEVWVDQGEFLVRYLEVQLTAGPSVLLPMTMAAVSRGGARKVVKVNAILASQFAGVPTLASPDQVTRDEEERICAYYGGGLLYATRARTEPLI